MWKYKASKKLPFWTRENANKPSKKVFDKWIKENMKDVDLVLNFLDFKTINLNSEFNGFKYIQIINSLDENDVRFYYITSIQISGAANTYKYNGVIDIYASYTLNFIQENKDVPFIFLRTHEYDKKCLQIEDENVLAIPKIYKNYYFQKRQFFHNKTNNIWYGENIGINGSDLVNANKYYVFKDGINGGYKFFPILSKTSEINISYSKPKKGSLDQEFYFWNGRKNNELKQEISSAINSAIVKAYNDGKVVEYQYREVVHGYIFPAETAWLGEWKTMNTPFGTMPIDVRAETWFGNTAGAGLKGYNYYVYVLGNQAYSRTAKNYTAAAFPLLEQMTDNARQFKVQIFNAEKEYARLTVQNSRTGLEIYRKKQENINKFLGIYYLPHFLNFDKFDRDGDYVFINIDPSGDEIQLFPIYNYSISTITDKLNNPSYSTPYFLKWLNIRYYGNLINAEFRTNEKSQIYLGGKLFFTDAATIISKSDDLIDLNKSIINYPYQLPIGVSEYEKYVQANRNVTDTSFSIMKQQQDFNMAKSLTNFGLNHINASIDGAASFFEGDLSGVTQSVMSQITNLSNLTFDLLSQQNQIAFEEKKIRAQYQKMKFITGNNIQFSTIQNASLAEYYDDESGIQFEGVEVSDLDENSLVQLNNYIFLNGYLNPKKDTLNNRINNERHFNFICIDAQILTSTINVSWNEKKYNNEIFELVINQLINGLRIWNIENINNIPEWDNDAEWPDQPIDPGVLPPPPPLITEKIILESPEGFNYFAPVPITATFYISIGVNYPTITFNFRENNELFAKTYSKTVVFKNKLNEINIIEIDFKNIKDLYTQFTSDKKLALVEIQTSSYDFIKKLTRINFINVRTELVQIFNNKDLFDQAVINNKEKPFENIKVYINGTLWK